MGHGPNVVGADKLAVDPLHDSAMLFLLQKFAGISILMFATVTWVGEVARNTNVDNQPEQVVPV